jgi:thioredoxin-related protein
MREPDSVEPDRELNRISRIPPTCLALLVLITTALLPLNSVAQQSDTQENGQSINQGSYSGAQETVYPEWFKASFLDLAEDVEEAQAAGKRVMLLFHQDGCPYCNAFVERNLAQKDIEETLKTNFDVIEINLFGDHEVATIDGQEFTEKTFSEALQVQFTPTILFLTETGAEALRINGYYNPDQFRVALRYVTSHGEESGSFNDFIADQSVAESASRLVSRTYYREPVEAMASRKNKGEKPLLVIFEQSSCRNCETLHDRILSRPESQELLEKFDTYQVDLWGADSFETPDGKTLTGRQWGQELGISYAPSMVLYAKGGEEVIRSEAWFKAFHTQSILDYVASDAWREQPNFQRYISERAETLQARGVDVDIWD